MKLSAVRKQQPPLHSPPMASATKRPIPITRFEKSYSKSSVMWGIFYMFVAVFSFGVSNIFAKTATDYYPLGQMVILRGVIFIVPWFVYLLVRYKKETAAILRTRHLHIHCIQGIFSALCFYFLFYAFKVLPLSEATAISFAETFILTALSVPLLKEKVGWQQWMAILVGFGGVLVVTQPTSDGVLSASEWGAMSCILAVTFDAYVLLSLRKIGKFDGALTIISYFTLFSTLGGVLFLPFESWVPIIPEHVWDIVGLGVFSAGGQIFVTLAFKRAKAGTLSPIIYTLLLWSLLFDEVIWGRWPSMTVLAGAGIIIFSGLYIIYHERRQEHAPRVL